MNNFEATCETKRVKYKEINTKDELIHDAFLTFENKQVEETDEETRVYMKHLNIPLKPHLHVKKWNSRLV